MTASAVRLEVEPCPVADRPAALSLLYRRVPRAFRASLVAEALADAGRGEIDLSGLWVARRRGSGRLVGVMLTQALSGRAAGVWSPEVDLTWGRSAAAEALVRAALGDLRVRGFRIAQALLDEAAPVTGAADLSRGGLPHVTDLVYLGRPTAPALAAAPPESPAFVWRSFGADTAGEFADVLSATYRGSLDMPELEGARSLDDVLAGHSASGRFDPTRWRLGRLIGEPESAAVVLLAAFTDHDAWEVTYLGLTPPARGRGLGLSALSHALDLARPLTPRLELAVDVRNAPARRLYRAAGFTPFARRSVHLAVLKEC